MRLSLNDRLVHIGVRLSGGKGKRRSRNARVDIEQTLIDAALAFPEDARLASLVFSWIKVHGSYVIVEKFRKLCARVAIEEHPEIRWSTALAAFAAEHCSHKWKKLVKKSKSPVYLFPQEVTKSAVTMKGSIPWLKKLNFIVPEGSLRIRESDVLTPEELIEANRQYRNRYLFGPSWRADIITAIQMGMKSPMEISKRLGCSYEPAYRVFQEYKLASRSA